MEDTPVFVISTGRSGSTLLQRLLNCHPDLVVWGEHHGFINGLIGPFQQMVDEEIFPLTAADNRGPALLLPTLREPSAPLEWACPMSREEYALLLRRLIQEFFTHGLAAGQRWGFKEVRYNQMETLSFLHELFPAGHFLFLRRNPLEVARSKVMAWLDENEFSELPMEERLQRIRAIITEAREHYAVYDEFAARHPQVSTHVRFERLLENSATEMAEILARTKLDRSRFDWSLASEVLARKITSTRADPLASSAAMALVADSTNPDRTRPH